MNAWQDIVAMAMVLAAGGFVAWRSWRALMARQAAGCGSGCGKCPSAAAKPVLQIEQSGVGFQPAREARVAREAKSGQVRNLPH